MIPGCCGGGRSLCRCFGANFLVQWTFYVNLLIQLVFALIQHATSWKYLLLIVTVWGPACLLALVFHEIGHMYATRVQRGTYSETMVWPLGGFNDCTIPDGTYLQEFFVAVSGPLMQVPLMIIWVIVLAVVTPEGVGYYGAGTASVDALDEGGAGEWFAQLAKRSLDVNIMIFALNALLPAYPLDAAAMVASMCGHFGMTVTRTAWVLVTIGACLGFIACAVGIVFIVQGSGQGIFLLLIGIYLIYSNWQMYGQIVSGLIHYHPVFKPDCYRRGENTNLSNQGPMTRQAPQRRTSSGNNVPTSPRRAGNPSPMQVMGKNNSPRGGQGTRSPTRRQSNNDIEMGQRGVPTKPDLGQSPKKSTTTNTPTTSTSATGEKKKKKKPPTDETDTPGSPGKVSTKKKKPPTKKKSTPKPES